MIRLIIRLAIVALIANAAWRIGSAYASFYKFKDAVQEMSQSSPDSSEAELRQRILELASQFDLPINEDSFSVRRENYRTYINGSYTQQLEVLPRYPYPWLFTWNTATLAIPGAAGAQKPPNR